MINSVLNSTPINLLSFINPPKYVIHDLNIIFAILLWNFNDKGKNKHWVAWPEICFPKKEDWVVDPYLMSLKNYFPRYGGHL